MWYFIFSVIFIILIVLFVIKYTNYKKGKIKSAFFEVSIDNIDAINGEEFEEIVCLILQYYGWKTKKTPKSHDYGADIIAKKWFRKMIVQTKLYYNHLVGNSAVQEIVAARKYYKIKDACVMTNWHFSKSAISLAEKNNVKLFDRKFIVDFLNKVNNI